MSLFTRQSCLFSTFPMAYFHLPRLRWVVLNLVIGILRARSSSVQFCKQNLWKRFCFPVFLIPTIYAILGRYVRRRCGAFFVYHRRPTVQPPEPKTHISEVRRTFCRTSSFIPSPFTIQFILVFILRFIQKFGPSYFASKKLFFVSQ